MTQPLRRHRWFVMAALALSAIAWSRVAAAQGVTGPALKAAFLYNFVKFAQWPVDALAPGHPLILCVLDDNAVADALAQLISRQVVDGHELMLQTLDADGPIRFCHLLYAGTFDPKRSAPLMTALRGSAVLSVGDRDGFAEAGGVVQFLLERDRMGFAINVTSAQLAGIRFSSRLLSLARIVKGERDVQH
jgi:hypothetical protein